MTFQHRQNRDKCKYETVKWANSKINFVQNKKYTTQNPLNQRFVTGR